MQDCGRCGPQWGITYLKYVSGTNYEFQFDAQNVSSIVWQVKQGCTIAKAGTLTPTSNVQTIDLSGVSDGEYTLELSCPNCTGYCFPERFRVVHNGGVIEDPLATPTLSAIGTNATTIKVDWEHAGGADDFTLGYSTDGETWIPVSYNPISGTLRTINILSLTTDTLYWFRIRARKGTNYSDWSNEVSAVAKNDTENPRDRKVLLHNQVEWDWINLSANNSKVDKCVEGGATHVTLLLAWWHYEPSQDNYDFTKFDAAVNYFYGRGLKTLVQFPYRFAYDGMLNNSPNAYIDISAAVLLRSGNRATSNIEGAVGSKSNPFYAERQLKLIARICDHINTTPSIKSKCKHALFIDGGSNETGFFTGENAGVDDGDFNPSTNNDFKIWLQGKYGSVGALNTAWGASYPTIHAVQIGDYMPTKYSAYYIGYSDNQRTKDWWQYLCVSHKLFYRKVLQAAHNPQSIDPTLSSTNTGIQVAAYLTEGLTGQGVYWGSGVINMLDEFDIIFSSIGATDGAHVGNNHLKSFAYRMSVLRGSLPTKVFGQEMDKDALYAATGRIGPSRLARVAFAQGAEWLIYVFYDEIGEWNEDAYVSINGDTLTFLEDSQLAVSTYVTGQQRTLPTPSSSLSFNLNHVLTQTNNPNDTVDDWLAAANPDAQGLSNTYVDVVMSEIL